MAWFYQCTQAEDPQLSERPAERVPLAARACSLPMTTPPAGWYTKCPFQIRPDPEKGNGRSMFLKGDVTVTPPRHSARNFVSVVGSRWVRFGLPAKLGNFESCGLVVDSGLGRQDTFEEEGSWTSS